MEECNEAFRDLKKYLVSPPTLSCPDPGEDLYMYLVVSEHVMSAVLLKNQKGVQRPIHYISKTLVDVETQCLPLASSMDNCIPQLIIIEVLSEPSIDQCVGILAVLTLGPSSMDPIIELPNKAKEAEKEQRVTARFWLS